MVQIPTAVPVSVSPKNIPGVAVRGVATGVLFMAFFGTLWAGIGIGGLQGRGSLWPILAVVFVGIALLVGGVSLMLEARRLPDPHTEVDAADAKRTGMQFGIVFGIEGIAIGAASGICNAVNRFDLFFPIMAFIVGAHFFPLAVLFGEKVHCLAGALLCVLALVTLFAVPESVMLGGQPLTLRSVVVGFGAAVILWGVGLVLWRSGRGMLVQAEPKADPTHS